MQPLFHGNIRATAIVVVLLGISTWAIASSSGLVIIPTADTVGAGEVNVAGQIGDNLQNTVHDTYALNTEIGVGRRWEYGVDFNIADGKFDPIGNAKYLVAVGHKDKNASAFGILNLANGETAIPFAVSRSNTQYGRWHLGAQYADKTVEWFTGIDKSLGKKWIVMADYTSGRQGAWSTGFNYQFNEEVGILVGLQVNNDGSGSQIVAEIGLTKAFREHQHR